MPSLDDHATAVLAGLQARGLHRQLHTTDHAAHESAATMVVRDGQRLLSFSGNDTLNLSTHPAVIAASVAATQRYGTGAGASRLVTGNHTLLVALEARLAALKGTQAACVFGSGYLATIGIVPALVGRGDLIVADALAHACLYAGALISRARLLRFAHNDMAQLDALLARERPGATRVLIVTERVFSMDGDLAPIAQLVALAAKHDAWLMTDDAHGLAVVPDTAADAAVPLRMGTLSKAAGSYGGYVCASAAVVALLHNRARSLIYSTGLPPGAAAAAIAALDVMQADPQRVARPLQRARQFAEGAGLPRPESPIVPVILGTADKAMAAAAWLQTQGVLAAAIRPPTVPEGTARLRLTFSAAHTQADVQRLAALIRALPA